MLSLPFFFFFPVTLSPNTAVSCIILFYPLSTIVDARGQLSHVIYINWEGKDQR